MERVDLRGVKVYVTLNTLLNELDEFKPIEEPKPDNNIKRNDHKTCEICACHGADKRYYQP